MKNLKSKKGIGLPTVLGIVVFLIGTTATFLSFIVFQSRIIDQAIERTETYENAMQRIDATLNIIAREENLNQAFLTQLSAYMNVTITASTPNLFTVTAHVSERKLLRSYITGNTVLVDTFDTIFTQTGQEDGFFLSPFITPTTLLTSYIPAYLEENIPSVPQENYNSFQDVINHIQSLASSNNGFVQMTSTQIQNTSMINQSAFVNSSIIIAEGKSLTIQDSKVLVINGNLTVESNASIYGNFIVYGTFTVENKGNHSQNIKATLYVHGAVDIEKSTTFGDSNRPTFIFSEQSIVLGPQTTGTAYFLANTLTVRQGNITLTGGAYAMDSDASQIKPTFITNTSLDETLFFDQAIPDVVRVESQDPNTGESVGFIYTSPKLS